MLGGVMFTEDITQTPPGPLVGALSSTGKHGLQPVPPHRTGDPELLGHHFPQQEGGPQGGQQVHSTRA